MCEMKSELGHPDGDSYRRHVLGGPRISRSETETPNGEP